MAIGKVAKELLEAGLQKDKENLTAFIEDTQLKTPQEAEKDLYFLHNTSEQKIARMEEMGGMPMPSIAVTRENVPFEGFGEVTLVGRPEAFDPKVSKNVMYDSDAYTARAPSPVRVAKKGAGKKIVEEFHGIADEVGGYIGETEWNISQLEVKKGVAENEYNQVERFFENNIVTDVAFLKEKGIDIPKRSDGSVDGMEVSKILREKYNKERKEWAAVKMDEYFQEDKMFISNPDRDYYMTPPRLKSYTAEEVTKYMKRQGGAGAEKTMTTGGGKVRGSTARRIKSLAEAKRKKGSIKTSEEMTEIKEIGNQLQDDIVEGLRPYYDYASDGWRYRDEVGEMLILSDKIGTRRALKEVGFSNVPEEELRYIEEYKQFLRDAPTEYFESKPERVVDISEFGGALVPQNASDDLVKRLEGQGLRVERYTDDADRLAKRKSLQEYAFSMAGITAAGMASMSVTEDAYADEDLNAPYMENSEASNQAALLAQLDEYSDEEPEEKENWMEATGKAIIGGVADSINEMIEFAGDAGDWLDEHVIDLGDLSDIGIGEATDKEFEIPTTDEPQGAVLSMLRDIIQFAGGYAVGGAFTKPFKFFSNGSKIGKTSEIVVRSGFADAAAFDAFEDTLAETAREMGIESQLVDFMATAPGDTEGEARFKNALEGFALGGVVDGIIKGVKLFKSAKAVRAKKDAVTKEALDAGASAEDVARLNQEIDAQLAQETPIDNINALLGKAENAVDVENITIEQAARMAEAGEELPARAININLANIDTPDDVKRVIVETADLFAGEIDEARRGVVSMEQTAKLADDMGMSVEDLLSRKQGQAFNAEEAVAARKILASSASRLSELSKLASGADSSPAVLVAFRQALSVHAAIQKQVSGMTAEAGRALNSFKIRPSAGDVRLDTQAVMDAIEASGGNASLRDMATKLMAADPAQLNKVARDLHKPGMKDMFFEVWINGLLSSPATHAVNALSNTLTQAWMIPEKYLAAGIGAVRGQRHIQFQEGTHQLYGMVEGFKDGMSLAWNTLKTGEPTDQISKMEVASHKAITADNLGIKNDSLARGVDLVGDWLVRLPGRMLMTSDELFKAMGYRAELRARAYRSAVDNGLTGDEAAEHITKILNDTPADLKADAMDYARYATFQNELGGAGKSFQSAVNQTPAAKLVMPFIRTPVNIVKFVGERTPLGVFSKSIREAISKGGAEADLALARIGLGTMAMGSVAALVQEGVITGNGPMNPMVRKQWMENGNQPYSLRVGDKSYSFNRLDPLGMLMGLTADAVEIMQYASESEDSTVPQAAQAVALATVKNLTSKTYLSGISELFKTLGYAQTNPDKANKAAASYMARTVGSFMPYTSLVAQVERTIDPTLREANGIIEYIKSRTPGLSADLPPRVNLFGEPITLEGGLGWDFVSPIYTSTRKDDPVYNMLHDNNVGISRVNRSINGVELITEQFHRYQLLSAGVNDDGSTATRAPGRKPLKEAIQREMDKPSWERLTDGPEGGKAMVIKRMVIQYREFAKREMEREYDDLAEKLQESQERKRFNLIGR